ncbi:hypothetical protein MAL1_00201 [Bacteriophage DSS3_MAL1]|nr:hypothetical protein MAL1_00201 [Bacteriophage DSS3_MAL1]
MVPVNHPAFETPPIAGMIPWACTYFKDGKPFGITLYGSDEDQVLQDNCAELPGLRIDGRLLASIPADDREAQKVIEEFERKK